MRVIENKIYKIIESDGITYLHIKPETITLEFAREIIEARLEFANSGDILLYVDGIKVKSIDKQARELFGSPKACEKLKAIAIFSNSVFTSFLGNFMIRVNLSKIKIPIKLFVNKASAIEWLKQV